MMREKRTIRRRPYRRLWLWLKARRWVIGGGFIVLALALGIIGFREYFIAQGRSRSLWDVFYLTLQLFVLESGAIPGPMGWELEVARLLAPLISAWAAVQALAAIFRDQFSAFQARFLRNHAVICGLGRQGTLLARNYHAAGYRVLAIERDDGNDSIAALREEGVIVLQGDGKEARILKKARLRRAHCLIAVCGDDGVNSEVALQAAATLRGRMGDRPTILVHIVDPELCDLLRQKEMKAGEDPPCRLEYFNIFDSGARAWLRENPLDSCASLLIVGLGHLGERLIVQAANEWKLRLGRAEKLPVTVVDREALSRVASMSLRYPRVERICRLQALDMDAGSPEFQGGAFLFDAGGNSRFSAIHICFDQETRALATALDLRQRLGRCGVPITVRLEDEEGLATLFDAGETPDAGPSLKAFGLFDQTLKPDLVFSGTHEVLARAIHEEYRIKQGRENDIPPADPVLAPWDALPEIYKESNRRQADHIGIKLQAIGCGISSLRDPDAEAFAFSNAEIETLAAMEHERWLQERLRQGWRFTAGKKDSAKKLSPYLVSYRELPGDIKELDRNTVRKLPLFLAKAGFQVQRLAMK